MLSAAAKIFSENYGVWGDGKRVKMGPKSIKKMVLPEIQEAKNYYVRAMSGDVLAGNVFACRWVHDGRQVCWITQLVVKEDFRGEGIATSLLRKLREGHPDDRGFGLLSSHPAAVRAALRAFGRELESVDLEMTKEWAGKIMSSSPVEYVRTASLHGSLFEQQVTDGSVSCADTKFPVDHAEPLEALKKIRDQGMTWPFGELPDGHEFLILVKVKTDGMRRDGQKSSEF
jgi:GNAT superfamily N-acetyltransferase